MRQQDRSTARRDDAVLARLNAPNARDGGRVVRNRHRMRQQVSEPCRCEGDKAEEQNDGVPSYSQRHDQLLDNKDTYRACQVTTGGVVLDPADDTMARVNPSSAERLVQMGWAMKTPATAPPLGPGPPPAKFLIGAGRR